MKKAIRTCYPVLPCDISDLQNELNDVFQSSRVTNFAQYTEQLESRLREVLQVKHALTVANASTGLNMVLSTLRANSEVLVPSYTFPSTVNAIVHAHLKPKFVDIDRSTCNICLKEVQGKITSNTSAILAVNAFGNPCQIKELETIAARHQIKLFFDSAAAIGAKYHGRPLGSFGDAEVFSLSGTKIVTAGEGGIITTNDDDLADELRCKSNYGYSKRENDCLYVGFNGKMSEFGAIMALWSLRNLVHEIAWRQKIAAVYCNRLQKVPGIHFQKILAGSETNFCAFAVEIDPQQFGLDTVAVQECLKQEGIDTLRYFCPPMHKTRAYQKFNRLRLEQSEILSQRNLCLPMHAHLTVEQARAVCDALEKIQAEARKTVQKPTVLSARRHSRNGAAQNQFLLKEQEKAATANYAAEVSVL